MSTAASQEAGAPLPTLTLPRRFPLPSLGRSVCVFTRLLGAFWLSSVLGRSGDRVHLDFLFVCLRPDACGSASQVRRFRDGGGR